MVSRGLAAARSMIQAARIHRLESIRSAVSARQIPRQLGFTFLVGFSYYLGTLVGFVLTPRGEPNSTFWPPNAILLASLLLVPRRTWWMFIVAVLPAHLLAQLPSGVPLWTAIGWFISNTGEALIGAFFITEFSGRETRLNSVRGVFVFAVFGVLIAPFATSFLDAAAVITTGWGHGYWPLSAERFWTNALAELTIVPAIMQSGTTGNQRIDSKTPIRLFEAALLGASTTLVAVLIFGFGSSYTASSPALLYLPLPLLLWAAVRFRVGGLSLALLTMTLIALWYTMHGRFPFPYASMRQNVLSLQILFCTAAVPLMFLSAVMNDDDRVSELLRDLGGRLINAQEQERARIGRELHDDINQRLAMLAIQLQQLHQDPSEFQTRLPELRRQAIEISDNVQALSHELYSSKLEYLGVVAGIKSWCRECSDRYKTEIGFTSDVASPLPPAIGLTLFRVAQEAVHNAVKHSGVNHVEVQLWQESGEAHLTVSDSGRGFDIGDSLQGAGLGLTSMRERAKLLNGTVTIHSEPMVGTTVHIRIPLSSRSDLERPTG